MTLTLEVSPETVQRVERAKAQGANMDTLLWFALEQWLDTTASKDSSEPPSLSSLGGTYEGEAWDELLTEIDLPGRSGDFTPHRTDRAAPVRCNDLFGPGLASGRGDRTPLTSS